MLVCAKCGRESEGDFAFCPHCGAELTKTARSREQRKTVTVLFCDVTGSTALAESTDPEALRAVLACYFERMKAIVESHGGTVEKFIGDAVMAVFGVPTVHEDDALRAVRAAVEMRDALPELGVEARIGVNTGEVVTGTQERLATGDAVNVAARLEQAAQPGEILLGEETLALVRYVVEAGPAELLELKGKTAPVAAFRLFGVTGEAARRHEAPLVGRRRELDRLRDAFEQGVVDRSCQLFTILGTAGVGKSRLAFEFLERVEGRVVRGRCLSYGEGITYWPVVEVLKQLDVLPSDPAAAASLRALLRESEEGTSAEEIAWGFRKLLEEQAHEKALVCVFDDIHWGEETFLDLIEHVADLSRDAPLLLLCLARPELLDRRPGWGGGKLNATTLLLEPLSAEEMNLLVDELGGVDEELRAKILTTADGNPLFLEEMIALVRASRNGDIAVPPTIQALLAARLDQLDPSERHVLERGAIEGRVFHRSAVEALAPEEPELSARLVALVRRELVRPAKPQLPGDDAFRFRHLLIRDAAYDALPKGTRAELHERFAAWLQGHGSDLVELDEILGHHLEQAARYRRELGKPDEAVAERAAERLAAAGRRALWRLDRASAALLLERALKLTSRADVHLELDLAAATSNSQDAARIADRAVENARRAGNLVAEALARVVAAHDRMTFAPEPAVDELEALVRAAVPLLEEVGDHAGLVRVWDAFAFGVANFRWQYEEQARAAENALRHARLAGLPHSELFTLDMALVYGPRPADEALRTLDAALPESPAPRPLFHRAWLLAMLARFDDAWHVAREAEARARELSGASSAEPQLAEIATLAGDHELAASYLQRQCERVERLGERSFLSTYAPRFGRSLCALGRHDEAEPLAQLGRDIGDEDDIATQAWWRQTQALVHASRGEHAAAESLARQAVVIVERTDALNFRGYALTDLAEVLAAAGGTEGAVAALEQALDRYERKKNLAMVAQVRPKLEALRAEARP
ncbi:MAG TPA: adenylate/guanylate cyclase domain-containing protein [Gaiellaceae bacterium]